MTYLILREYCRLVLSFILKNISVKGLENVSKVDPILFASHHPNSLIDGIVLNCAIKKPTYSLARGDAFSKKSIAKFLKKVYLLPIYRISEGKSNMVKNDETFEACFEVFKTKGQVLIYSEGICNNQTQILPLKKGTARLASQVWANGIDLHVNPVGLKYGNFDKFGKNVNLEFPPPIKNSDLAEFKDSDESRLIKSFNDSLYSKLTEATSRKVEKAPLSKTWLYYLGWIINFPLYLILIPIIRSKTKGTVFFDAGCFLALIILLPFYWLMLSIIIYNIL